MKGRKIISWLLILSCALVFNTNEIIAYAASNDSKIEKEEDKAIENLKKAEFEEKVEPKIVRELEEKRTANTKHFLKEDMTVEAVTYDEQVHYKDGDKWVEINNELDTINEEGVKNSEKNIFRSFADLFTNKEEEYINTNNDLEVRFSKKAKEEALGTMKIDNYEIKWGVDGANNVKGEDTFNKSEATKQENQQVEVIATEEVAGEKYKDLTNDQKKKVKENKIYNEKIKNVKNNKRSVLYKDIKENVDLKYVVKGTTVKEDIILKAYKENFSFKFNLNNKGLKVKQEGKEIIFTDKEKEEEVFRMLAPNMIDANGEYSEDVEIKLSEDGEGYNLEIIPNNKWLADSERKYPVTIDPPIVSTSLASKDIKETFVVEKDSTDKCNNQYLRAGWLKGTGYDYGRARSFIRFENLPKLTSSDMVVDAKLYLLKETSQGLYDGQPVDVHEVTGAWNTVGLKWNTQPNYDSRVADTSRVNTGEWQEWNITSIVKKWYSTGKNYGIMLKRSDEWSGNTCYWSSDISDKYSYARPSVTIQYRNFNGMEDYWSYHSQAAGRAGNIAVNDYTGNLVNVHSDFASTGNRMPVSISHVYNTNDNYTNDDYGNGWRLSVKRTVFWDGKDSAGYKYYKHTDSDGTSHYFKSESTSSEVYKDMDGLDLTLTRTSSEITIKDKKDNKQIFDARGFIIRDEDNNGNKISYTYDGYTITKITDGVGRTYTLTYKTEGKLKLLDKIREDATGKEIVYKYQYGYLIEIIYPDKNPNGSNITTKYVYNEFQRLSKVTNYDGYELRIAYYDEEPRRVKSINEFAGTTAGGSLNYEYGYNKTKVIDEKGRDNIIHFNDWGNPVGVQDEEGRASLQKFITTGNNKNKLSIESKLQTVSNNIIKNHNMEFSSSWSTITENGGAGSSVYSNDDKYGGLRSIRMDNTSGKGSVIENQDVVVIPGKTYTLSAYVRSEGITGNGTIEVRATYGDGTGKNKISTANVEKNGQWNRYNVTFDIPKNAPANLKVSLALKDVKGTAYFDCVQLEEGNMPTRYNFVENADFDYSENGKPIYWRDPSETSSSDKTTVVDNKTVFNMYGERNKAKQLTQWVDVTGKAGDNLVVGGWAKGATIETDDSLQREFAIYIGVIDNDTRVAQREFIRFNKDYDDWQYVSDVIIPKCDYKGIYVEFIYWNNANEASLDNVQLYKEEFGTSYIYDDKGNPISVTASDKKKAGNEFNAKNDLIKSVNPKGNEFKYDYDDKHNITKATSAENIVSTFKYDKYGNPTNGSIQGDKLATESSTNYTANGNYTKSVVDTFGNKVSFNYDEKKGILNKAIDQDGKELNYKYDDSNRLIEVNKIAEGKTYKANYEYSKDRLSKINFNGSSTNISYDEFGNQKEVSVTNNILISNKYKSNNGNLESSTYGTGDKVVFDYDNYDKVTKQSIYKGNTLIGNIAYTYDNEGTLVKKKDSINNMEFKYNYDIIGRVTSIEQSDDKVIRYAYDDNNNVRSVMETYGKEDSKLISKGKATKASSVQINSTFVAMNVNDCKADTRWGSAYNENEWIEIDLGSKQNINRVVLNWEGAYAKKYDVEVSNDEKTWKAIYSNEFGSGNIEEIKGLNSDSRYIRVKSRERASAYGISLYEFEVYDDNSIGTSYEYDKDDRIKSLNTSGGLKVDYVYDEIGRITNRKNSLKTGEFNTSIIYEDIKKATIDGKEKMLTSSRVKTMKNGDFSIDYTYNKKGNIETITENGKKIKYYYDDMNQLIREDNQQENITVQYIYDEGGNIQEKKNYNYTTGDLKLATIKNTKKYSYDKVWKDKLVSYDGADIQYDKIGNPIKIGNDVLTWNRGRKLESYTKGNTKINYKYNESGIRTEKNINGNITKYHLVGDKVTYEEKNSNGTSEKLYYKYDASNKLVSFEFNNVEYLYVRNNQGDIIGLVDCNTGQQVTTYKYNSFGKILEIKDTSKDKVGEKNPYRYRGYRYDEEIGLYYLQSRYYSPEWGRFINLDGLMGEQGDLLSHNLFAYCKNNPINMEDSTGFRPIESADFGRETYEAINVSLQYMQNPTQKNPYKPRYNGYTKYISFGRNKKALVSFYQKRVGVNNIDKTTQQGISSVPNDSRLLAKEIKSEYKNLQGEELDISQESLTWEIYIHMGAFMWNQFTDSSDVCDAGEASVDWNRVAFDRFSQDPYSYDSWRDLIGFIKNKK